VSTDRRIKKLAAELKAHDVKSPYLERIEARLTREEQVDKLQAEIMQEMAGALGRSDLRVNIAMAELELQRARYERAVRDKVAWPQRAALVDKYNALREVALQRLRELLIHREAVGFRRNHVLNELYPVGPKLVSPPPDDTH
jgi:hypothetical protein